VTILVSAFVSLTLTPMMSAKLLKTHAPKHVGPDAPVRMGELSSPIAAQGAAGRVRAPAPTRFYEWSERVYERVIQYYGRTLKWVLRHQTATLLVTAATLGLTLFLYVVVPNGFFPVQDTGVILGFSDAPQNISFAAMSTRQQHLAQVILKDPEVA